MAAAWLIGLSILMPRIVFSQSTRARAAAAAAAYFLAASLPAISVWKVFAPDQPEEGVLIWLSASAILTIPWTLLWSHDRAQRIWRIPMVLLLSTLPPIGLIGWASPLTAAGILLPGTGLLGLAATSLLPVYPKAGAAAALIANLAFTPPSIPSWVTALNTSELNDRFAKEECARAAIHAGKVKLSVLPEGAVPRWTEATEAFWSPTIEHLQQTHRTALVGAGLPIPSSNQFKNAIIVIGEWKASPYQQRIPIPVGMWKPFSPAEGVPLNLAGPGTLQLGPHRLAVLICYEQLLVWPILHSAFERPTLIVGVSNAAWTSHTNIPAAQEACLKAWSRLFGIPFVSAVNTLN